MTRSDKSVAPAEQVKTRDGFDVLDVCHRQTIFTLGKLSALVTRLSKQDVDDEARDLAKEIHTFFSTISHQHHEDEELHVFPALEDSDDPDLLQAIARLKQDHHWLEADWRELAPQIDAVANGQSWWDIDTLRESSEVFIALSHDHIALEESYIYPKARSRLPESGRNEMSREMAARRHAARKT